MGAGDWRIALAVLGGTGWGWSMTLGWMVERKGHPALYPTWQWVGIIAIDLVLLVIDVWCINVLINSLKDYEKRTQPDSSSVDDQGRPL
jgi:hypothetical protein